MQNIVVTGSSRGIGLGLARAFLAKGCRVVISSHTASNLELAMAELKKSDLAGDCYSHVADMTVLSEVETLWNKSTEDLGRVDIWINNAGAAHPMQPFWKLSGDEIKNTVDVNLMGTIYGSHVAMRGMIAQGSGHIYNMEGQGADGSVIAGMGVFGTAKAGVHYFSKSLIAEAKTVPVNVSTLIPGIVRTSLQAGTAGTTTEGRIFLNMLGEDIRPATEDLAGRILANRSHGACINRMSPPDMIGKVVSAPLRMIFGQQ
ncbi:SDR family oxidoreductase [Prosthecochloris sp.]|uniref:SDR family NAD(P)-dependent oxidoreductase n=1 Tax=Prosthecochloris sp. TaxID=290513 RepID=UPI0025F06274|nr:SDR family oxidoreductase [Prosthecochloris sp.]